MSGRRPLFRSPKFAEGMTSDAIEESGEKVCMFAIGRGNGAGRRFESVPEDANEPIDISILKPGRTTAITLFQKKYVSHYSLKVTSAQSVIRPAMSILAECVRGASLDGGGL